LAHRYLGVTHPTRIARPARALSPTRHQPCLQALHDAGQPRRTESTPSRVGHLADDLGAQTLGNALDVPRHVTYLLAFGLLAAAIVSPPAGSRSPGSRGRSPARWQPASPRGPCGAGTPAVSALADRWPVRS